MFRIVGKDMSEVRVSQSRVDEGSLLRAPSLPLHETDLVNIRSGRGTCPSHRPWVPKHEVRIAKSYLPEIQRASQTESGAGEVTLGPWSYSEGQWYMPGRSDG